jgi:hypothetical protein
LVLRAHRRTGYTVVPLVKLPTLIQLSEAPQGQLSGLVTAGFYQGSNVESA